MESHSKLSCNSKNDENNIILLWIMYHFQRDGTWYNWLVEEFVKTLNLALVCSCVRLFATRFLRIRSLLFSESAKKMFQTLFWQKFPFCPFWPKILQIWHILPKIQVFCILSKSFHYNLLIFGTKPSLWSRKIWQFTLFGRNPKMTHYVQNWPKFGLNLVISGYISVLKQGVRKKLLSKIQLY